MIHTHTHAHARKYSLYLIDATLIHAIVLYMANWKALDVRGNKHFFPFYRLPLKCLRGKKWNCQCNVWEQVERFQREMVAKYIWYVIHDHTIVIVCNLCSATDATLSEQQSLINQWHSWICILTMDPHNSAENDQTNRITVKLRFNRIICVILLDIWLCWRLSFFRQ